MTEFFAKTDARNQGNKKMNVMMDAPLSVCLDANLFNSYTSGIMRVCGNSVDHCVQAVGVDTSSYWLVRNSWGTSWGESGFIRLSYGSNTCDITNDPVMSNPKKSIFSSRQPLTS